MSFASYLGARSPWLRAILCGASYYSKRVTYWWDSHPLDRLGIANKDYSISNIGFRIIKRKL